MPNALDRQINARVEAFVAEITAMARQAALDTLRGALGESAGRAGRPAVAPGRRLRGGKRPPGELIKVQKQLAAFVAAKPGSRMEQIGKALGYKTAQLTLPMKKLIKAKQVKTKGQKRSRQYFPG
ncbi:MAG TPA: hypothetical protein VL172_13255 [Kofleriaceae bacterium]|jgi:hypothetical protein|nr:hypothetical protein [Kofleriaceae bacterium]